MRPTRSCLAFGVVGVLAGVAAAQAPHLNEVYASHAGVDNREFIELVGAPGAPLDGVVVLIVDGDSGDAGMLDRAWDLSGKTMPNDGFFVLGDSAVVHKDFDLGPANNIENGTMTIYVVSTDDPGALLQLVGQNLDADGDGVTDIPSLANLLDAVALVDGEFPGPDRVFDGAPAIGPAGASLPPGIYRGQDYPNPWCGGSFLDFDPAANAEQPRTPGASNGACVPLALAHFGLKHETLGAAGLAVLPDGSLRVSNLHASGQNGVSIDPRGAEHHEVSIELPLGDLPQPAEIVVEESWPQGAGGELSQVSVIAGLEPPDWLFTEVWTEVPSPPGDCCYLIEVYRIGLPIPTQSYTICIPCPQELPEDIIVTQEPPLVIVPAIPLDGELLTRIFLRQTGMVSVAGQPPVLGDYVEIRREYGGGLEHGLARTEVRASGLAALRISGERIGVFGNGHRALGPALLDTDWLTSPMLIVSELDPSGESGIAVDVSAYETGALVELTPVEVTTPSGLGSLVVNALGAVSGVEDVSIGSMSLIDNGVVFQNHLTLQAELAGLGATDMLLEVLLAGSPQGSAPLPAGLLADLAPGASGAPRIVALGLLAGDELAAEPAGFVLRLAEPVPITPTGGSAIVGDEVRLLAANATTSVEALASLELRAADLEPMHIVGESELDTCTFERYCVAAPNSVGAGARIEAIGSCRIADNDLTLVASPVPNTPGLFFFGTQQVQLPFGDGFRCVGGQVHRLPIVVGAGNTSSFTLDLQALPDGVSLQAGDRFSFQCWYRDPAGLGSGFNLSDALSITFQ